MFNKKIALIGGIAMTAASIAGVAFFSHRKMKNADIYDEIGNWLHHYGKGNALKNISSMTDDELASEKETAVNYLKKMEEIGDDDSVTVSIGVQVVLLWIDAALDKRARAEEQKEKEA